MSHHGNTTADLHVFLVFDADKEALVPILEQMKFAFTANQFEVVKSRIISSPHSIVAEGSSILQIQAAKYQVTDNEFLTPLCSKKPVATTD
jgi:hypothetical protein